MKEYKNWPSEAEAINHEWCWSVSS